MSRLNTAQLILDATNAAHRSYTVQQDPAVRKAWTKAGQDCGSAIRSIVDAASETRAAWLRTAPPDEDPMWTT